MTPAAASASLSATRLTHLQMLEAEAIHIMREVVAEAQRPVMLYSIGKDSAVMLHLAAKAFYPAPPPFPLLHVDTTWKFQAMYEMRDRMAQELGAELIVYTNPDGLERNINPFDHGSAIHTQIWKTEGLRQALDKYGFDAAFGGARRDEEKSRAKERIFSFRSANHRWDPKSQRPELWRLYNAHKRKGESIRVFPLSNWTEMDIWQYIRQENIPLPSLYFSHKRQIIERHGQLLAVGLNDERGNPIIPLLDEEKPRVKEMVIRFRTVGDASCTGAVESTASTIDDIVAEVAAARQTERGTRADDKRSETAMEDRKKEGYF